MTMDYSPWSEREIWPFLRVAVSLKLERPRPPKLVYMHVTSIHTCINSLSRFRLIIFFDDHGLYTNFTSKTKEAIPNNIGVHASNVNFYLHKFFESILFFIAMPDHADPKLISAS